MAGNLKDNDFQHVISEFPPNKLEILGKKDAYPNEWVDSYEKLKFIGIPPKECFYSSIKDGKVDIDKGYISDD